MTALTLDRLVDQTNDLARTAPEPSAQIVRRAERIRPSSTPSPVAVRAIEHDSRLVGPGSLYCAISGAVHDGHDFIAQAVAAGALGVIAERPVDSAAGIEQIIVDDVRAAMPWFATSFCGMPSHDIDVVGVTGTNGKTTTTHLLGDIARNAGRGVEIIGTLSGQRTTPESPALQRTLRSALDAGLAMVAMEVSSHALDQHRSDGVRFAVSIFTNLSPDHLDYHQSMDDYFEAKAQLFDDRSVAAVINIDDERGRELAQRRPDAITISLADVEISAVATTGSTFSWRGGSITLPLAGRFNILNALCAAEAASVVGFSDDEIRRGLASAASVPGRMDLVGSLGDGAPAVYVDYSHTPDSLEHALVAAREFSAGRVITVFGCGGDRDASKRPLMGAVAKRRADVAIVTSDNPRSEDPDEIISQVLDGMGAGAAEVRVEPDRRAAIALALDAATASDVIVIAGKGHETTQTIGNQVLPFDDRIVVAELAAERGVDR